MTQFGLRIKLITSLMTSGSTMYDVTFWGLYELDSGWESSFRINKGKFSSDVNSDKRLFLRQKLYIIPTHNSTIVTLKITTFWKGSEILSR